jgi:hypothetical protein
VGCETDAESTGTDWEHWSQQNEALASRVPYMVSIGNHEYDYSSDDHHNDPSVTDGNYSVDVQAFPVSSLVLGSTKLEWAGELVPR